MSEQLAQLEKKGGGDYDFDFSNTTQLLSTIYAKGLNLGYTFNASYKAVYLIFGSIANNTDGNPTATFTLNNVTVTNIKITDIAPLNSNAQNAVGGCAILKDVKQGDILRGTANFRTAIMILAVT